MADRLGEGLDADPYIAIAGIGEDYAVLRTFLQAGHLGGVLGTVGC